MLRIRTLFILALIAAWLDSAPPGSAAPLAGGAIAASVYRNDRWDVYVMTPRGDLARRLTFGEGDNRFPAWSPDGKRIAFESNRGHNWDIYVVDAMGGTPVRLTTSPGFEGSPSWSPDGTRIVYTADLKDDLDIYVMNADGTGARNLTPTSPAQDYDPVWSPDGKQIAFSTRRDSNKEIYLMNADGSGVANLTQNKATDEEHPAWSPDGKRIAFVSERGGDREVYFLEVQAPQRWQRVTALQTHNDPVWTPAGDGVLLVASDEMEQSLRVAALDGSRDLPFSHDRNWYRQPDWNGRADPSPDAQSLARTDAPLYVEKETPNPPEREDRYNMVAMPNMRMSLPALLSDRVDDSYAAWRARVREESGWDFLGNLSESYRPLSFKSEGSDYLSWHKAGRAADLLWDYIGNNGRIMEVARENVMSETYWRVYLRAAKQDGSMGEPLRTAIWDVSPAARIRSRGAGGLLRGLLPGYYVDVTELARQYGWRRISSHTLPDFDWRDNFLALEYWHYEKKDGLTWWDAIREVYPSSDLGTLFTYDALRRQQYNPLTAMLKGVWLPPEMYGRFSALEP